MPLFHTRFRRYYDTLLLFHDISPAADAFYYAAMPLRAMPIRAAAKELRRHYML